MRMTGCNRLKRVCLDRTGKCKENVELRGANMAEISHHITIFYILMMHTMYHNVYFCSGFADSKETSATLLLNVLV